MSTRFLLKSLPAALLALGLAGGAYAQAPAKLSHADREFIENAAKGGMAEVELGQFAQQHASNEQVKQFAAKMVTDHSKANEELRQLAQEKGVTMPAGPSHMDNHEMTKLSKLTGADFDREYMKNMVKDHEKDVKDFQKEASKARDPDVKNWANKTLPTLQVRYSSGRGTPSSPSGDGALPKRR